VKEEFVTLCRLVIFVRKVSTMVLNPYTSVQRVYKMGSRMQQTCNVFLRQQPHNRERRIELNTRSSEKNNRSIQNRRVDACVYRRPWFLSV